MAKRLFYGSIRKKLVILVLLATLPAFAVHFVAEMVNRQRAVETAYSDTTQYLRGFSEVQRRITDSTRTLLKTVAAMPEIRQGNVEDATIILQTLLQANPIYTNILLVDIKGNVVAAGKGNPVGLNFADRKQFREALQSGEFAAGEYVVGKATRKAIFPFGIPVYGARAEQRGAIIIGVDLNHYVTLFDRSAFPEGTFLGLCDYKGIRIFRYPEVEGVSVGEPIRDVVYETARKAGQTGTLTAENSDGLERIIAFEPLALKPGGEAYGYMFLGLSQQKVLKSANAMLIRGTAASMLSLSLVLVIAWWAGGRGIASSLETLTRVVQRLGSNKASVASGIDYSDGEVGALGQAFDNLSTMLRQREAERNDALYRLGESEEQYRILLEANPVGICLVKPESRIIEFANPAFMTLLKLEPADIGALRMEDLHPEGNQATVRQGFQRHLEHRGDFSPSVICVTRQGKEVVVDIASALVVIGGRSRLAVFFTDITSRKRDENTLLRAKESAELANRAKDEFLANISHEIRTPLNGVMGMLQLILKTRVNDEQQYYADTALRSSRNLLNVLNDVLDFSKIEAGRLEIRNEPFEPVLLVNQCVDLFRVQADEKEVEVDFHIHPSTQGRYLGDEGRIRQVLFNLLGNAVKFTRAGSITLEVYALPHPRQDTDRLFFSVQDSGVGIPDDKIGYIFESFTQVDGSLSRKYQGSGLGLPIAKKLVGLMGGNMVIESQEGEGTTVLFCVQVGRAPAQAPVSTETAPAERPSVLRRILLVEDEKVNSVMARMMLEKSGHVVTCAENGKQCLQMLLSQPFDVVLMDMQMPVMDGIEATRRIREDEQYKSVADIPIIALTAHAAQKDKACALASGMDAYLSKPFEQDELEEMLCELVPPARAPEA